MFNDEEELLLLFLCRECVNGTLETDLVRACEMIYDQPSVRFNIRRRIIKGESRLNQLGLIKLEDGIFRSDRDVLLTEKALEMLFEEDVRVIKNDKKIDKSIIEYGKIKAKKLYFDAQLQTQMTELRSMLSKVNYLQIRKRLENKNLPVGMNILFYGPPGTGKTASAYQIAAQTKRNIMMVDISDTKSFWFGESEKIIKKLFEKYNSMVIKEKVTPILLINECDAILNKRREVGDNPVGQTENAIQNILLQQMEDMEGILIATTNLNTNLDPAFERRFLHKILFEEPSVKTRSKIWKNKIDKITMKQAGELAEEYQFSGGNIDNIARKIAMKEVISGKHTPFEKIIGYCNTELLLKPDRCKIGFNK